MTNIHHPEMTYLVRREKQLERELKELRDEFGTWKERIELAENAGRDELAQKARKRVQSLRAKGRRIRGELKEIVEQKRELRKESRRPTGEENRRAEALLNSFKESGLVDPDEAQLKEQIEEKNKDTELEAFKAKAGLTDEPSEKTSAPPEDQPAQPADGPKRQKPRPTAQQDGEKVALDLDDADQSPEAGGEPPADDEDDLDAELAALREKMGEDTGGDEDVDLDELEGMLDDEG